MARVVFGAQALGARQARLRLLGKRVMSGARACLFMLGAFACATTGASMTDAPNAAAAVQRARLTPAASADDPAAPQPPEAEPQAAEPVAEPPDAASSFVPAPPVERNKSVRVRGLTGTLNTDDVYQTMDAKKPELDACIAESRRRLRWVSGRTRYAFRVDRQGAVESVRATESSIGHHPLERCIMRVLAAATFPKPDGEASADFTWDLGVEPVPGRKPEPIEPSVLDKVLAKHGSKLREQCETKRRERFAVTAYLSTGGRIVTAGAVPTRPEAVEKVECVLERLSAMRFPKQKRIAKVSFTL